MAAWCGSNATVVPKAVQMLTVCNGGSHCGMSKPGVKGAEQNERLLAKNHCHHACMVLRLYAADGTAPTSTHLQSCFASNPFCVVWQHKHERKLCVYLDLKSNLDTATCSKDWRGTMQRERAAPVAGGLHIIKSESCRARGFEGSLFHSNSVRLFQSWSSLSRASHSCIMGPRTESSCALLQSGTPSRKS